MHKLKPRMIDHLRVSKLTCSTKLISGRDSGKGAEYVEDVSVAMRSGTIQHSRDRLEFGFGFGPKETDHVMNLEESETGGLTVERRKRGGAEYVEGGSVAMRSGTVQHSRDHLEFGFGFGPKETDHVMNLEESETSSLPNRLSKDKNPFNKKTL